MVAAIPLSFGLLAVPATAQQNPAPVPSAVEEKVESSPDELLEYWTPERIEEALANPMDASVAGPAAARSDAAADDAAEPVEVSADAVPPSDAAELTPDASAFAAPVLTRSQRVGGSPVDWPRRAVGKLLFRTSGGEDRMCSATSMVSDPGSTIWTAAHCLHSGENPNDFHTSFIFLPAYEDGWYASFWFSDRVIVPADWANNRDYYDSDVGAIVLQPHATYGSLQNYVGAFGYSFGGADHTDVHSYGYPGNGYNRPDSDFAGAEFLMYCRGDSVDASNWDPFDDRLRMNCDMGGGASGGPMVRGVEDGSLQIVGVNSHRNADSQGNWVDNYLFSSEHGSHAAAVIDLVNN